MASFFMMVPNTGWSQGMGPWMNTNHGVMKQVIEQKMMAMIITMITMMVIITHELGHLHYCNMVTGGQIANIDTINELAALHAHIINVSASEYVWLRIPTFSNGIYKLS